MTLQNTVYVCYLLELPLSLAVCLQCIDANFESVSCNLDLILKWMTLRFFDTNPAVIMKGLELILNIFMQLADYKYKMLEQEASAFIPYVIVKVSRLVGVRLSELDKFQDPENNTVETWNKLGLFEF